MNFNEVMERMRLLGAAGKKRTHAERGAGDHQHGVSLVNLKKLKKQIQTDHELAKRLWSSNDMDAQRLASMIADPDEMSQYDLDRWVEDIHHSALADVFVTNLVIFTPHIRTKIEKWTTSQDEWIGRAGWQLLSQMAVKRNGLPDSFFEEYLKLIRKNIHSRTDGTKEAMNNALVAIGLRNTQLESMALAVAADIGTVQIDREEKSRKIPDAALSIKQAKRRRKSRKRLTGPSRGTAAKR